MPVVDHFAGEKDSRLTIVDGCQPVESVYVNLRTAVLPNIRQEIVEVTQSEVDQLCGEDGRRQSIGSGGRPICIDHIRPDIRFRCIFTLEIHSTETIFPFLLSYQPTARTNSKETGVQSVKLN
jgi:hypothetical protein